jgi:ribosomal RNA-processing protein 7
MAPVSNPTIGGFHILPISIPPVSSFPQSSIHHIYLRRNEPKTPTADDTRSLFVTNLPVDSTEPHIRALFASLIGNGRFESITLEDDRKAIQNLPDSQPAQATRLASHANGKKRKRQEGEDAERAEEDRAARLPDAWARKIHQSGATGVVVLADGKSVDLVLKAVTKLHRTQKVPTWPSDQVVSKRVPSLGTSWLKSHNRLAYPDPEAVQASVDAFFALYNRREQEAAELAKRLRNEPDEDGFVTVVRGGSNRNAPAREVEAEEAKQKMLAKQQKKKEEMTDFYRFQVREKMKEEQEELKRRFEDDRRKVSAMREKKGKFRPES